MTQTLHFDIRGMTCDHCVRAVTDAAKTVAGVTDAEVTLATNSATVEGDSPDPEKIIAAIKEEGYEATLKA